MTDIHNQILAGLKQDGITPHLGLIPEQAAAKLLNYSAEYFRQLASQGRSPIPHIRRGNRRLYKTEDIARYWNNYQ